MSSLWIETTKDDISFNELNQNKEIDICVIGAGLFGLTTAYYLSKNGKKVVVIEKDKIGEKVSGNTTGKITSQHGLFYDHLIADYGKSFAQKYLEANEEAISNIKKIIEEENIECDFEEKDAYVYTTEQSQIQNIEKEVKAVNDLGKEAEFLTEIKNMPFKIKAGIKFKKQAQFHARKYMIGLCKAIVSNNCEIFENTTAIEVEKTHENYIVHTNKGNITSKKVVIATHYPIINFPGFYFAKMYQSTSYLIAIETNKKLPEGMSIGTDNQYYSFRTTKYKDKEILLIGGAEHKTGEAIETNEKYRELEELAKKYYPDYKVLFKWNTRDCISLDKIPYIGEFSVFMKNVYIGTGFKKWGMTLSNVAANIVKDKILEKENKYEDIFNSQRIKPIKNRKEKKNMVQNSVNNLVFDKFRIEPFGIEQIENDNGAIIEKDDELVGVYKDITGKIYAVKPICSHLGCLLNWNNTDKTWDCPCHGSRFDYMGKNLYEPAIKGLKILDIQ